MFHSYAGIYGGHVNDLTFDDWDAGFFGVFISTNGQATVVGYDIDSYQNIDETQSGGVAAQFNVDRHGVEYNSNSVAGVSGYGSVFKDVSLLASWILPTVICVAQRLRATGFAKWAGNNCYSCHDAETLAVRSFQNAAGNDSETGLSPTRSARTGNSRPFYLTLARCPCIYGHSGAQNDGGVGLFGSNNKFITTNATSGDIISGTLNLSTFQITETITNRPFNGPFKGTYTLTRSASVPFDVPPTITTNLPSALTAAFGTNVTLSLVATGSPPMCYQWYFNGIAIPKATTNSLVLSNLQYGSEGIYSVSVNNAAGGTIAIPP